MTDLQEEIAVRNSVAKALPILLVAAFFLGGGYLVVRQILDKNEGMLSLGCAIFLFGLCGLAFVYIFVNKAFNRSPRYTLGSTEFVDHRHHPFVHVAWSDVSNASGFSSVDNGTETYAVIYLDAILRRGDVALPTKIPMEADGLEVDSAALFKIIQHRIKRAAQKAAGN